MTLQYVEKNPYPPTVGNFWIVHFGSPDQRWFTSVTLVAGARLWREDVLSRTAAGARDVFTARRFFMRQLHSRQRDLDLGTHRKLVLTVLAGSSQTLIRLAGGELLNLERTDAWL